MKSKSMLIGTGVFGVLVGVLLSGNVGKNDLAKIVTVATLLAVPTGVITHSIGEEKATKKANELEDKLTSIEKNFNKSEQERKATLERLSKLNNELTKVSDMLKNTTLERDAYRATAEAAKPFASGLQQKLETALKTLEDWEIRYSVLAEEYKAAEDIFDSELEKQIEEQLTRRVEELRNSEIKQVCRENNDITDEAMVLMRRMKAWAEKLYQRHEGLKIFTHELTEVYNKNIDTILEKGKGLNESFNKERDGYLTQIDCLHQRIALLQHELNGGLTEPEKVDAKHNPDLFLGNHLCSLIFEFSAIPLRFYKAYTSEEGLTHLGFMPSKGSDCQAIALQIERHREALKNAVGVYEIISINHATVLEGLEIVLRRSRPIALKEEEIYRIMERSSACTAILRQALDHTKGGKPTMRVMGSTGQGKGILTRAFIADWVKNESGEVWFSDPMDGSSQDYWNMPKAARGSSEGGALLSEFAAEFRRRKDKQSVHPDTQVLAVFDEFDKEHPDGDKDKVKKIWTAIRHHQMKLILLGQSGEVGESGWKWDEMGNCALVFVGTSIGTAFKHNKDLGISGSDRRTLEKQHAEIKLYLEENNQGLTSDVMHRVALLVKDGTGKFLELPPALKDEIPKGKSVIVSKPWESLGEVEDTSRPTLKMCPVCGHKLRKAGSKLRCENKAHTRDMGLKTFSIAS